MTSTASRASLAVAALFLILAGCDDAPADPDPDAGSTPTDGGPAPAEDGGADPVDGGGEPTPIPEGEVFETLGRLSVADRDEASVTVWDLDVRGEVSSYALSAPATLYGASSRQITAVVAAQPGAGRFDVFAVGVWVWDHVDHFHVYKDPAVIQMDEMLAYTGGLSDLHVNGGWVVAFDDASGAATGLLERSIGPLRTDVPRSRAPIFRTVEHEGHDGVAVVARGHLFVTAAGGGVQRYVQDTMGFEDPVELACPSPGAGEAAGFRAVFDCADDLLLSRWDEATESFEEVRIARPDGVDRPTRFLGEDDLASFVAVAGDRDLIFVDIDGESARAVTLEAPIVDVEVDRDAQYLLVLLDSGELLDLDPATGAERRRVDLGASSPLFDLTPGDGFVYVSEPDAGRVHEVDLDAFAPTSPIEVGGHPGSLVVTALWPGGEPVMH